MDDAEAKSLFRTGLAGAFMGEAGCQSQPRQATKSTLETAKLPYSGTRDTSSP